MAYSKINKICHLPSANYFFLKISVSPTTIKMIGQIISQAIVGIMPKFLSKKIIPTATKPAPNIKLFLLIKIINFKFLYRHCERSEAISSYSTSMRLLRPRWGARNDN
ncbi:MAG: hypothetical protein A3B89_00030 [Candidatus Buchananbacteria bacterium RIFCSPHIGHO2_02_FULL_40_13]|uniref:Uncharacterized protein n=1 Tax=Candidatus Buchananbacteria bacterium RIFCSPLOWO2_01_FULL_39_33 TaxID=1797543 RepID=A0A1G1YNR6_9BACT|nr:MAG: hypothetical protein A3B89_00030 [Candidatus Buchananbacteria bacterium RIFCSPHIGHO2_02_FULL_40_13]OGY53290.1 MAG: hypothetical protein A3A02_03315 [Candidatus Buchananbacteria bacterium RIFCSPLOWO2_01_FULL_39_33]